MFSTYEPELFPGLIYRMKSPKLVILIFVRYARSPADLNLISSAAVCSAAPPLEQLTYACLPFPTHMSFRASPSSSPPTAVPSGKVVITGAKKREHTYEAFEKIYDILQAFRKQ